MDRRTLLRGAGLAAGSAGLAGCTVGSPRDGATPASGESAAARRTPEDESAGVDRYRNPVFEEVFADPTAIRADDGTYYAYATFQNWGGGEARPRLLPIARSADLVDWSYAGAAFDERPEWTGDRGLWAPDVARLGGRYVLYYSVAAFGDPNPGIGVAVADDPAGPFVDQGPLLWSEEVGVPNSIDPYCHVEGDAPYLFWGSKRGIYAAELTPDCLGLAGDPFRVAGGGVEAASLRVRDGRYYFFGSRGTCCTGADSTYRVVVGRADDLRGPYRNRDGEPLTEAAGTTILHGGETFAGPGHNTVVRDDAGDDWLLYHAYERSNPWAGPAPRRVLMLDRLRWRDGWPVVPGRTPSRDAPAPSVAPAVGDDG